MVWLRAASQLLHSHTLKGRQGRESQCAAEDYIRKFDAVFNRSTSPGTVGCFVLLGRITYHYVSLEAFTKGIYG